MKKEDIRKENICVEFAYDTFRKVTENERDIYSKRLRSCNAVVYENPYYYYLVSYRTCVAFIEKNTGTMYDVLRMVYGYTVTSAQHISKFAHDYCVVQKLTYREI